MGSRPDSGKRLAEGTEKRFGIVDSPERRLPRAAHEAIRLRQETNGSCPERQLDSESAARAAGTVDGASAGQAVGPAPRRSGDSPRECRWTERFAGVSPARTGIAPLRKLPKSAVKPVFSGAFGCTCTQIRAEIAPWSRFGWQYGWQYPRKLTRHAEAIEGGTGPIHADSRRNLLNTEHLVAKRGEDTKCDPAAGGRPGAAGRPASTGQRPIARSHQGNRRRASASRVTPSPRPAILASRRAEPGALDRHEDDPTGSSRLWIARAMSS